MTLPIAGENAVCPPYALVALPLPLEEPLTYAVPAALRERAAEGMRALVPVRKRALTGYIVGFSDASEVPGVRNVIDLPDEGPVFSAEMLALCRWLADYYCCSWGEALQTAVPAGIQVRTRMRYTLVPEQLTAGRFTDRQRAVVAALHRHGPLTDKELAREAGATALSNTVQALARRGVVLAEPEVVAPPVSVRTERYVVLVEATVLDAEEAAALQRRAPKQAAVYLDLVHGEPERPAALLYDKHRVDSAVLRALERKGLVRVEDRESYRIPETGHDTGAGAKHPLNDEQRAAYDAIVGAMEGRTFQTFLLQGITGSGKTEVYLQAIERALALGRGAIILVPEISLTPQTVGRFKARFDTDIAVLHSGLGAGERYDEWRRAQRGEVRIVVGARSAVFAPLPDLGIVVVDEEHDHSYKQTDTPRYHARDVAIMRAKMNDAVCVAGSATPALETFHNTETGKSIRLVLRQRATRASLPGVQVLDMRTEKREHGGALLLSDPLEEAIQQRVQANEQVLLLLNRRGFSPFVLCPGCGWVAECDDCQVTLTYHAKGATLACHYCNARREVPAACEQCGFTPLQFLGTGTQKIEDYLLRSFPETRIERMDADTTAGKGGHARILGRLAAGEIDILVGTQMIAKGHDYPRVTLVGVINADAGLALPDFRAAENVFQLLTQVAGRAGRGGKPGEVLVQTYRPGHYAIRCAAEHDYAAFYEEERTRREEAGYPPFRRMANLAVEAEDALACEKATALLFRLTRDQRDALGLRDVELLGPAPATVRRVKKKYRWNLGLLSRSGKRLNRLVRAVRPAFHEAGPGSGVTLKADLDPYGVY